MGMPQKQSSIIQTLMQSIMSRQSGQGPQARPPGPDEKQGATPFAPLMSANRFRPPPLAGRPMPGAAGPKGPPMMGGPQARSGMSGMGRRGKMFGVLAQRLGRKGGF